MQQFESLSQGYNKLIKTDPMKQSVQYPTVFSIIKERLESANGKHILDVGCGNGVLAKPLSDQGAHVVAYDDSESMIMEAKEEDVVTEYYCANQYTFQHTTQFDLAFSNLVICYAKSIEELEKFFESTYAVLKSGSTFFSVVVNPEYDFLDQKKFNRLMERKDNQIEINFLDSDGNTLITSYANDFSKSDYEKSAIKHGFTKVFWKKVNNDLLVQPELGEKYWEGFDQSAPYIVFVAQK